MTPSHSIDPCPAEARDYAAAWHHSAFARRALPGVIARGQLLDVRAAITPDALNTHFQNLWADMLRTPSPEVMTVALRQFRNSALLAIMARDLAGRADLNESLESITALADITINAAYASAMAVAIAQHGIPRDSQGQPQDMMIIGMGKLGGRELNASSDVDLIYVFPDDGETDAAAANSRPIDAASFFIKVGRRIAALLGEVTADGIVFRVDLRLRPNGDSGPLAVSLGMLEQYFIVQGREWERYAWIKARVVNQPVAQTPTAFQQAISGLHDIVRPFVFRRYLDFNVMAALRELHGQIREEAQRRQSNRESHMAGEHAPVDVKLGPGGIREIEFIAQLFQLIRGGKEEPLRARSTREIYHYLERSRRLEPQEVKMLLTAYEFWRRLEHRLQYLDDAQTHVMPGKLATIAHLAQSMSYESAEAFLQALEQIQRQVQQSFERLFTAEPAGPTAAESGRPAAETRLERLKAQAQRFASETANPEQTLIRLHQLLESIGRRASYLALFDEYPNAFLRVAHLVSASAWAADYLRQHPIVLDELLDMRAAEDPPDQQAFIDELRIRVAEAIHNGVPDIEQQMDALRETHHAALFRLLVQDLDGRWSVETLSDHLSAMADSVLQITLETVWPTLARRHRDTPKFAVIAYGRLGGKELGYASDLDLIFLYDDPHESASEIYARYAQRFNVWLSTATAAGTLFDIDLRLRPNGNAGLLVTSMEGFLEYQHRHAWVWEHQALTRARFCAGDRDIGQRFEAERKRLLSLARPTEGLLEEVLAMRQKMHDGHPNPSAQFDIKHDRGGMVDIEFIVQTLVLSYSHAHPTLTGNLGNIALLRIAGELGLIDAELSAQVGDAYRGYRKRQHAERLSGAASARVDAYEFQTQRAAVIALWNAVFLEAPATIRSLQELHQSASGSA